MNFRLAFAKMAPQAIVSRSELAELLCTTEGAISQMIYRGELPVTAFPGKRRTCWFVSDIRHWLDELVSVRSTVRTPESKVHARRIGRPRNTIDKDA